MKIKAFFVASAISLGYMCLPFTACANNNVIFKNDYNGEIESVVFTANTSVIALDDETTVEDYLFALKDLGEIDFEAENSQYGLYILSVNGKENYTAESGTSGYSWALYTNLDVLDGVIYSSSEYGTYMVDDDTILYCASYGVSGFPCVEGYTYALVYAEWSW